MAIYKNREVHVIGPNPMANSPETISVQYKDGTNENVKLADVKFTKGEKDGLLKNYPSKYDSVATIEDADLEAVRVGVAPPSDPSYKEAAETKQRHQKQQELTAKNAKLAEDNANKANNSNSESVVSEKPVVDSNKTTESQSNFIVPNTKV